MSNPLPKVSVVIATRERPVLLRRAVQRVMDQHYAGPIECVIVFDQSDPHPIQVEVPPGRELRVVTNHRSPGLAGARNSGVLATTGELVAFCDDDDEWLPEKLERQVAALRAAAPSDTDRGAEVATSGIFVCYEDRQTPRIYPAARITLSDLLRSRVMEAHPSTVVVTRAAFDRIGFVDEHIPGSYAEDYEWLLRAARETGILAVQEPLVNVHWHQSSWFSDRWKMIVDALTYLLEKVPEFQGDKPGLARIYGQIALAHAASGEPRLARSWARRTIALHPKERRAYVALLISARLVKVETVQRLAHAAGKGL
ncbi:MAG: glycosyltransferase family 2 protein [Acidimicrobiia bacterium]